jgi:transposase
MVRGTVSKSDAAATLNLSPRQLRRLVVAYQSNGPAALVHANRGRTPWQAVSDEVRAQVIRLAQEEYAGLSQSQLTQRLATEHGIVLHRTTVRRVLISAGLEADRTTPMDSDDDQAETHAPTDVHHTCLGRGRVPGCHCE